ncbi:hypothetical protein F5880DRAFT_1613310 [Lentinula raphanica]|nr:hypothetical protein F5880DRAFT_1613310 [Lentinula raphanica]
MAKRKNSKSNTLDDDHDTKRKKDKDTRDKDKELAIEGTNPRATTTRSSTTRSSSSKASASKASASKASASKTSTSKTSTSKASTSKASTSKASTSKAPTKSLKSSTSKSSKSKSSKKETKTKKGSSAASKSSSLPEKKPTKDSQGNYMTTLNTVAPPKEVPQAFGDILLNEDERNADLGDDVLELYNSEDDRNKFKAGSDKDEDMNSEEEESSDDNMVVESGSDNNMIVKDATQPEKKKKKKKQKKGNSATKILESQFENVELARLGKSSVRMSICILDMWPKDEEPDLDLFTEELVKTKNDEVLQSLKKITSSPNPDDVKVLLRFMNYGSSQVRSDLGKIIRILVAQYFELSVSRGEEAQEQVADKVKWLLKKKKYHQKVDIKKRTYKGAPFSSPLIGKILRAYFVDSPSYQDVFLIKYMKRKRIVPLRLVVMITTLIEHAILEWNGGYKVKIHLTRANTEDRYNELWRTVELTEENAKTYIEDLGSDLYEDMMSNHVEDDLIPVYDYKAIEAEAQAKRAECQRLRALKDQESDSSNSSDSSEGSHSSRSRSGSGSGSGSGSESDSDSENKSKKVDDDHDHDHDKDNDHNNNHNYNHGGADNGNADNGNGDNSTHIGIIEHPSNDDNAGSNKGESDEGDEYKRRAEVQGSYDSKGKAPVGRGD